MRTHTRTALWGRPLAASLAAVTLTVLSACTADSGSAEPRAEAESSNPPADGTVIQPGHPGEEAETLPPDASVPATEHNDSDVEFVQMMIPHHAQAIEMGELARTRANDEQVQALAERIADAQGAEILEMAAWLERHGIEAPTAEDLEQDAHHGGSHGGHSAMMPGMLSPAEMDELAAADGARFDELYLRGMIAHHQGAIDMAGRVMTEGSDIRIGEIAADVSVGQTAEIERMRTMLGRL